MTEKIVYDPKEHAANQKNAATKNPAKKEKPAKAAKSTKNPKDVADAKAHAKDGADVTPEEPVKEFKTKVNKYGFLHVPKRAVPSLPFGLEKPLIARIDGEKLVIAATMENQTK
jgi:hypothetical protein